MSVIPLKAGIDQRGLHVRFVPTTDSGTVGIKQGQALTKAQT